jgi:hypothetical protein
MKRKRRNEKEISSFVSSSEGGEEVEGVEGIRGGGWRWREIGGE